MRDISNSLFLVLMVSAGWTRVLPFGRRVRGLIGLVLTAAALPFVFWPVMAPVSKAVQIVIDLPLLALWLWAAVLAIKDNEPQARES